MSDWTPTTKQVRNGYRFDPEEYYRNPLQAEANAERAGRYFDRWLERVKAEAWDEGRKSGLNTGITIAEVVTGTKPPPYPEPEPNPYRH